MKAAQAPATELFIPCTQWLSARRSWSRVARTGRVAFKVELGIFRGRGQEFPTLTDRRLDLLEK